MEKGTTFLFLYFQEGDLVKKEDQLAIIDHRQAEARVRQAKAALAEARRAETAAVAGAEFARIGNMPMGI